MIDFFEEYFGFIVKKLVSQWMNSCFIVQGAKAKDKIKQ